MEERSRKASRQYTNTCVVENCDNPCWKEVCRPCGRKIRTGTLPPAGNIKPNPICEIEGCNAPAATTRVTTCRGHWDFARVTQRPPAEKREKVQSGKPKPLCKETGCQRERVSKGLCSTHYSREVKPRLKTPCVVEGCEKVVIGERCARHKEQYETYGFVWTKDRPNDLIRQHNNRLKPICAVHGCSENTTSHQSALCYTHAGDKRRKQCTLEFFLELKSHEVCQSCGNPGRLVVDHDHSCPHARSEMCQSCIRGVLCNGCNTALGLLEEDEDRVLALLEYMRGFSRFS